MTLRDTERADAAFAVDEAVKRALEGWGKARDPELGRAMLAEAADRMTPDQRAQLRARLAEVSLGILFVLENAPQKAKRARTRRPR